MVRQTYTKNSPKMCGRSLPPKNTQFAGIFTRNIFCCVVVRLCVCVLIALGHQMSVMCWWNGCCSGMVPIINRPQPAHIFAVVAGAKRNLLYIISPRSNVPKVDTHTQVNKRICLRITFRLSRRRWLDCTHMESIRRQLASVRDFYRRRLVDAL